MKESLASALSYLYGLQFFGMKLGLDNTRTLLASLGNPHDHFPSIHVAGTNGKGSTCAVLASIFGSAGCGTGLYTSPHIHRFSERIKINGDEISEKDIVRITKMMRRHIDELKCTFFEAATAMAFQYFNENKIDFGIIETGLGGRLDATNVVRPEVSVITNIDLDHTEHLGKTIPEIAFEKAGIIKPEGVCLAGKADEAAKKVLEEAAKGNYSTLFFLDDIAEIRNIDLTMDGSYFDLRIELPARSAAFDRLYVKLSGEHQIHNACLAAAAALLQNKFTVTEDHIREGLESVNWKARLEWMSRKPAILLDAAHNPAGMKSLRRSLEEIYKPHFKNMFLIVGMLKDKDHERAMDEILPPFEFVVTVTPNSPRAMDGKLLLETIRSKHKNAEFVEGIHAAVNQAKSQMSEKDLLVIAGSHFVLSEIDGPN